MWKYKQRVKTQKESLPWWYALPHLSVQCSDSTLSPGFKALQDQCRTGPKWGAPSAFYHPNRDLSSWALCQAQLLRGPSFSDEHIIRTHCWYTICVLTSLSICFQHVSYLKLTHINISLNLPQGVERLVKDHYRSSFTAICFIKKTYHIWQINL